MLPVCSKCDKSGLYQNWPIIGGTRSGSMIAGGVLLCPACATEEIARLRAELELDTEFAHAPDCTGKGISRMCAGCIEAEQLRHFAEIDRLTAILAPFVAVAKGIPENWPAQCALRIDRGLDTDGMLYEWLAFHPPNAEGRRDAILPTIGQWRAAAEAAERDRGTVSDG